MKKLLFVAFIAFSLASCKEATTTPDGSNDGNNAVTIEGVWNFDKIEQINGTMKLNGAALGTFSASSSNESGTAEFKSDGTMTSTVAYTQTTIMQLTGLPEQEIVNEVPQTTTTGEYVYDEDNSTITLTANGQTQEAEVVELTASKFVYKIDFVTSQTENGVTTTSESEIVTTFSR